MELGNGERRETRRLKRNTEISMACACRFSVNSGDHAFSFVRADGRMSDGRGLVRDEGDGTERNETTRIHQVNGPLPVRPTRNVNAFTQRQPSPTTPRQPERAAPSSPSIERSFSHPTVTDAFIRRRRRVRRWLGTVSGVAPTVRSVDSSTESHDTAVRASVPVRKTQRWPGGWSEPQVWSSGVLATVGREAHRVRDVEFDGGWGPGATRERAHRGVETDTGRKVTRRNTKRNTTTNRKASTQPTNQRPPTIHQPSTANRTANRTATATKNQHQPQTATIPQSSTTTNRTATAHQPAKPNTKLAPQRNQTQPNHTTTIHQRNPAPTPPNPNANATEPTNSPA